MKPNLKKHLEDKLTELRTHIDKFSWEDKISYGNWLAQTYYFASHTTNLLALAAARCQPGEKFQRQFAGHLAEEVGHDKLLINDMKFLGFDFSKAKELTSTSALYQTQYYGIEHKSPLMFFGYMLMLEAAAAEFGPKINERVEKAHGKRCMSFLKVHSAEDIDHAESDIEAIHQLSDEVLTWTILGMNQTFERYSSMLLECQEKTAEMQIAS